MFDTSQGKTRVELDAGRVWPYIGSVFPGFLCLLCTTDEPGVSLPQNYTHCRAQDSCNVHTYIHMYMLRASCLKLEINEFGCYEVKIEESEKGQQPLGVEPRTPLA